MSSLNGRLRKLEQAQKPNAGCAACADRPRVAVVYGADALGRPPEPAEACACGWEPTVINVVYVKDWRAGQC